MVKCSIFWMRLLFDWLSTGHHPWTSQTPISLVEPVSFFSIHLPVGIPNGNGILFQ
jgi:hypothetical protein